MVRRFLLSPPGALLFVGVLAFAAGARFFPFEYDPLWSESAFFAVFAAAKALAFMLVLPLITLFLLGMNVREFGWRAPSPGHRALFALSLVLILLLAVGASFVPAFRAYYSLSGISVPAFAALAGVVSLAYYIAEEFLFRGFLLFGLARSLGGRAVWVGALLFALFHAGKPGLEVPLAFLLGALFSFVALRTKSFIPAALLHFVLALALNVLVTFVWPSAGAGTFRF